MSWRLGVEPAASLQRSPAGGRYVASLAPISPSPTSGMRANTAQCPISALSSRMPRLSPSTTGHSRRRWLSWCSRSCRTPVWFSPRWCASRGRVASWWLRCGTSAPAGCTSGASGTRPAARARDRLFSDSLSQPDSLVELWRSAGLADAEIGSLTIHMDYQSFDALTTIGNRCSAVQRPVCTFVQTLDASSLAKIALGGAKRISERAAGPHTFAHRYSLGRSRHPSSAKQVNPSVEHCKRCYSYVAWTIAGMSDRTQLKCCQTIPPHDTRTSGAAHDMLETHLSCQVRGPDGGSFGRLWPTPGFGARPRWRSRHLCRGQPQERPRCH